MQGRDGKEVQEGGDICTDVADSLCCAAETNTTLQSNYSPILKKRKKQERERENRGKCGQSVGV